MQSALNREVNGVYKYRIRNSKISRDYRVEKSGNKSRARRERFILLGKILEKVFEDRLETAYSIVSLPRRCRLKISVFCRKSG